ncbi:Sugar (pentulose or hexulose) kinase [Mucilaginibacter lappiensis]|uniref:Sugar (Pentulose or hexulose) kinase n=1 Tax=Mucilaginibacter lappiensis TaxID=354630 RepID=A0ABR6PH29_9SPHI|nr:FGGY family carbohydrate kinase [Mucilaginibacter lappiensis]MBB6109068.1 sugar (pentulose or hexulose) kinase [Mucilaginibacter lappiensis]SIQ74333.1 Sugar (pentulose or hexulose) kinase [Mucilaginibacter lappiensis]
MAPIPVIAVFDVGKTNKKLFLFDENYKIVFERTARFTETHDEDGDACENLDSLRLSVFDSLREIFKHKEFDLKAVNFSTYGASFVYVDDSGNPLTPLYNYLKPYPPELGRQFYETYGDEVRFARETASPVLGNLNSGLQLYRLKYQQPEVFKKIKYALHLPQYMSYLLSGQMITDLTSIGCHTALWDFSKNNYHNWVEKEGILPKMAPLKPSDAALPAIFPGSTYSVGIGLHDSSAALIPYLVNFNMPFVLISTGTWSISLNPFNQTPLTEDELKHDCLNYLQYKGSPVKASRLFSGYDYEQQVKRIAIHFNQDAIRYRTMTFEPAIVTQLQTQTALQVHPQDGELQKSVFEQRDLHDFKTDIEAYHQLMMDIIQQQAISTGYVLQGCKVQRIFVDGGFSKNTVFMHLLAFAFPNQEVYAASMAQATAVGTALAIHQAWNTKPLPHDLIELKYYSGVQSDATLK